VGEVTLRRGNRSVLVGSNRLGRITHNPTKTLAAIWGDPENIAAIRSTIRQVDVPIPSHGEPGAGNIEVGIVSRNHLNQSDRISGCERYCRQAEDDEDIGMTKHLFILGGEGGATKFCESGERNTWIVFD
jgi:hypothetical protein